MWIRETRFASAPAKDMSPYGQRTSDVDQPTLLQLGSREHFPCKNKGVRQSLVLAAPAPMDKRAEIFLIGQEQQNMESWPALLGPHAECWPKDIVPRPTLYIRMRGRPTRYSSIVCLLAGCVGITSPHTSLHSLIPYMITGDLSDQHWTSRKTNLWYLHRRVIK